MLHGREVDVSSCEGEKARKALWRVAGRSERSGGAKGGSKGQRTAKHVWKNGPSVLGGAQTECAAPEEEIMREAASRIWVGGVAGKRVWELRERER